MYRHRPSPSCVRNTYIRLIGSPKTPPGEPLFLSDGRAAERRLNALAGRLVKQLGRWGRQPRPRTAVTTEELAQRIAGLDPCPPHGADIAQVLDELDRLVLRHGVRPFHPWCAAHLHSPTLLSAAATELAIGVTNQSMDSYDQAPAATLVEDHLVRWLGAMIGLPAGSTGVITSGGTASNLLGLLLARDRAAGAWPVAVHGLPPEAAAWRIVASRAAHFSVQRAAAVLGLGHHAVVPVEVDAQGRLDPSHLTTALSDLAERGRRAITVVGTAGTTDAGAIDPLVDLADQAHAAGAWFHVDAAVAGAFCLSDRLRPLITGIARADSVTVDMHKLWWQPIGASALLVRDPARLAVVRQPSDYLDRPDDADEGVLNLVGRSLDTSRRFDALKVLVSLRHTGRQRLAALVEHLVDTARAVAAMVASHPELELLAPPSTVTVLFRWTGRNAGPGSAPMPDPTLCDQVNTAIQRRLFASGQAVVGRTRHGDRVALKLTLVNPRTTAGDMTRLLELVAAEGRACQPLDLEKVG
jgi:L-2,4-diaminobutyrate decarboxylase